MFTFYLFIFSQLQPETPKEHEEKNQSFVVHQEEEHPWEEDEQPTFAIDVMMSPAAQSKIDEFIASLNAEEDEEVSDRDLIPINFKPTSRLTGMYTPSPNGSRVNSRTGSRSNSRSGSRRASVSNSRRNSAIVINKTLLPPPPSTAFAPTNNIISAPTFTVPDDDNTPQQSHKLFAASSSMFSRKTPYTSAAVTPAIGLTPDEFAVNGYFDDQEGQENEDFTFKPDFLNETQYSLNESLVESAVTDEWNPLDALSKLKEHSESMVLRQSLQEALVKTVKEQQEKDEGAIASAADIAPTASEFIPINKINKNKKKYAFRSAWDDEEYDLPSALVSGESSPRTPIARCMSSSDLTKEIELEKERYKQQRASLMLAQPQAAVASMLEAELDLSRGTLFKRRYYDTPDDQVNLIKSSKLITQETSKFLESENDDEDSFTDFAAYYDDHVIQEAQKRLRALVTGEEVDTASEMPVPIGGHKTSNITSKKPSHMYQYGEVKSPQPLGLLWNNKSYTSNFGFDSKHKLPIYQPDLIPTEDVAEAIKSLSTEIIVKEDPYTKKHRLAKEEKERKLQAEQKKLEEDRLLKDKKEEEESAKISIQDANLTLDSIKTIPALNNATKPSNDDSNASNNIIKEKPNAITTAIETLKESLDKSASLTKDIAKKAIEIKSPLKTTELSTKVLDTLTSRFSKKTTTLETQDDSVNNIPIETSIPNQKIIEKKPLIAHQASSTPSSSSISSSSTTRQSFSSHTSSTFTTTKSTKTNVKSSAKKSNVPSLSITTNEK
jgi:hypothetical protein